MANKYREYNGLDLPAINSEVLKHWDDNQIFEKSIQSRPEFQRYVFYEGPPSANGLPGIHHVLSRAIKDIFCRFKTLQGYRVDRKAGWDTHGLPVELGVEKAMGITKEDIGTKVTVDEYNAACRKAVMKYTDVWNDLTRRIGYWVNMDDPYVTYENKYIESVWWLLKQVYDKDLLYKGYTIQPYSPAAGTGLSSHELNQPGCYRNVKDTTVTAQFKLKDGEQKLALFGESDIHVLAWTTTPWTLPSNTALAVGPKIAYVLVDTYNQYTFDRVRLLCAKPLVGHLFSKNYEAEHDDNTLESWTSDKKKIPFKLIGEWTGKDLVGLEYEQLIPYVLPYENADKAFRVIPGDFVTTEDGTGIVHIAPTFGADDARVAQAADVPAMLVLDKENNPVPLVDLQGRFVDQMKTLAGKYVKNEYYPEGEAPDKSVDVEIAIQLKEENKAFRVEKYEHNYPHCWRTDKPVLYYPMDSWFIRVTAFKDRMAALNKEINWKPKSTGEGRFGNWLENANDWNLSRSRFWGIPLPIWSTEDGKEVKCIGSVEALKEACDQSVKKGFMDSNPYQDFQPGDMSQSNYDLFDLHKNHVDKIVLVSDKGQPMKRESDLIDVWFDSGSMPYAQWHYPFENKALIDDRKAYPADFIAEGVDQTRGWFYTLHAISTMCFDGIAYKAVVSNGLVLDKNGQKMSKRLGNSVDPFETLDKFGADATRWYMITNAQPWDNLKFDVSGIEEVTRKLFGTLYNTYGFFALYANIDAFDYKDEHIPVASRPEIDRWILSKLNSLVKDVTESLENYEPTKAGRLIQEYVLDHLSNWYVRLCRRRFWKGSYSDDKRAAYQTLYTCLETISILSAPIAPFYADRLFMDLNAVSMRHNAASVHLATWPEVDEAAIDEDLEQRMALAQQVSSMVLSLRKKERLKVRQPLQKIMVPVLDDTAERQLLDMQKLILSEVNVKELELLKEGSNFLVKKIKPNFKTIGPKYGKQMKAIAAMVSAWGSEEISAVEKDGGWKGSVDNSDIDLDISDFEILTDDVPGWVVNSEAGVTVALDITLTESLKEEGMAREFVNRIQNLRKDKGLDVTDRIELSIKSHVSINTAINNNLNYICAETLAESLELVENVSEGIEVDLDEGVSTVIGLRKLN